MTVSDVRSSVLYRVVSVVLSASLLVSFTLGNVSLAMASQGGGAAAGDGAVTGSSAPAVPVEMIDKRTETATHYRMPDGTMKAVISRTPIRFKDDAGSWQPIDCSLVPGSALGESRNASGPYRTTFASTQSGDRAVTLAKNGWSVGLTLLDASPGLKLDSGDTADYVGVAPATSLSYESVPDGLKETLVVSSAKAPSVFRFRLTTDGLALSREKGSGCWVLTPSAGGSPVLRLGTLMIADSSSTAAGIMAPHRYATMSLEPTPGGAIVTYDISRAWLDDPARVFPVRVDPTFTTGAADNWVVGGNDWQTFAWSGSPLCVGVLCSGESGDYTLDSGPWGSYLKFDTSSISGKTTSAATITMTRTSSFGNIANTLDLSNVTSSWSSGSFDWYSQPSKTYVCSNSGTPASPSFSVSSLVAGWAATPSSNLGVAITGDSYWDASNCEYREYSLSSAQLAVTYQDANPTYTITPSAGSHGSVAPSSVQTVASGGSCTVTFTPDAGYHVSNVTVDSSSVGTPTVYTFSNVVANHTIAATFAINTYTITPSAGAHGSISPPTAQTVNYGGNATFTVTPDSGWTISSVTVDGSSVGTPSVYAFSNVVANHTIAATFVMNGYTITPSAGSGGSISPATTQTVAAGQNCTFTITPDSGCVIATVTVDGSSVGTPSVYTFASVSANHTISATFRSPWHTVTASAGSGGSITPSGTCSVYEGDDKTFAITPSAGYCVSDVVVDGYSWGVIDTYTFPHVYADHTISASFAPCPPPVSVDFGNTHAVGSSWWTESVDASGNPTNPADSGDAGRGIATIAWRPATGATSQNIYIFDGYAYRQVTSGLGAGVTSWSTSNGGSVWPSDSAIASMSNGRTSNPLGSGLALRDDPRPLYAKMYGNTVDDVPAYFFKVTGVSGGHETPVSVEPTIAVELPNRSVRALGTRAETFWDAGQMAGHAVQVALGAQSDGLSAGAPGARGDARLMLSVTDLSIPSYGPAAEVSRTYRSDITTADRFAQGWVFSFDRGVTTTTAAAVYTDEEGTPHTFTQTSPGVYRTPPGMVATLTPVGSAWSLEQQGGTTASFNASGAITSETDRNSNTTTYTWSPTSLVIQAANGQQITVSLSSRHVTQAAWQGRTFSFAAGSLTSTVTCYANSSDAYNVLYSYSSDRLQGLSVPSFAPVDGKQASWAFSYSGAEVTNVRYPGYGQGSTDPYDRETDFTYGSTATGDAGITKVERIGRIDDQAHEAIGTKFVINPDGSTASRRDTLWSWLDNPSASARVDSFEYAPSLDVVAHTDPVGATTRAVFDGHGDQILSVDALGNATTTTYGAFDLPVASTDPRGSVTSSVYDTHGNLTRETKSLSATDTADSRWTYDGRGLKTAQFDYTTPSHAITTTFTTDACGEISGTSVWGVALDASASVVASVTTAKVLDVYGNTTSEIDAVGKTTTNAYSQGTGLRELSSTDPSSTVTYHTYDVLGNETGTYKAAGGQPSEATSMAVLPTGEAFTEVKWGNSTHTQVIEATTHTIDPLGHEVATDDSMTGSTSSEFDSMGNQWYVVDAAGLVTQRQFDSAGKVTLETPPGNSTASSTVTVYDAAGRESKVTNPDGSWTGYVYDACGNRTDVVTPTGSGNATDTSTFDLGGRVTSTTSASQRTTFIYDLLGRKIGSGVDGASSLTTALNDAGWTVRDIDSAGVVTSSTLDASGRVTRSEAGGKITATTYDACGRVLSQANPDLTSVRNTYDVFGRLTYETHLAGTTALKILAHTVDFTGRDTSVQDQISGLVRTMTYATSPTSGSSSSLYVPARGAAITLSSTSTVTSAGREGTETLRWSSSALPTNTPSATRTVGFDTGGRVSDASVRTATSSLESHYGFDASGHWVYQEGLGLGTPGYTFANYGVDGLKSYEQWLFSLGGKVSHIYTYNSEGRLTRDQLSEAGGTITSDSNYAYDASGEITHAGPTGGGSDFTYSSGHLSSATISGSARTYTYDTTLGRRSSMTSGGVTTGYGYDGSGHLTTVTVGTSRIATFTYDAAGQRMSADTTASGSRTQTNYLYEGITLHSLAATVTASNGATSTFTLGYAYSGDGRPYAGVYEASNPATRTLFAIVANDRGDVMELTDSTGMAFARYRYDSWGNPLPASSIVTSATYVISASLAADIANRQPLRYAGYAWDGAIGLYYCSQRYYDPATCQFISADPAKADGEESAYQYCGGDPVGKADSSGLAAWWRGIRLHDGLNYVSIDTSWYGHATWLNWVYVWGWTLGYRFPKSSTMDIGIPHLGQQHIYVPQSWRGRVAGIEVRYYLRRLVLYTRYDLWAVVARGNRVASATLVDRSKPTSRYVHMYDALTELELPWGKVYKWKQLNSVAR